MARLATRLASGGYLHAPPTGSPMPSRCSRCSVAESRLRNTAPGFAPKPDWRPLTKFEARGLKLGHGVRDLLFRRA